MLEYIRVAYTPTNDRIYSLCYVNPFNKTISVHNFKDFVCNDALIDVQSVENANIDYWIKKLKKRGFVRVESVNIDDEYSPIFED